MIEECPLSEALFWVEFPAIIAFGNPLFDILKIVKDDSLLKKYNLMVDGETEISEKKTQELLADLQLETEQRVSAGGSAQNIMRILQWLYDDTFQSRLGIYCGGIGDDYRGAMLEKLIRLAGVDARYAIHPTLPTGFCVSLINETSRTVVVNIGAASVYTLEDLEKNDLPLDNVNIIYIEGFFITQNFAVAKELVKKAEGKQIIIAFNLNSTYIFKDHHAAICEMVGCANIVFGNAREMIALAQALEVEYEEVTEIPFLLNSLKRLTFDSTILKDWLSNGAIFVMTQGDSDPAIIVFGSGESFQVKPFPPKGPVVDTRGVGDALVAGFLAGVLAQCNPKRCLEWGCKVASFMVTRLGVTLPNNVPPDLLQ